MADLFLMCGCSGAGKSTFLKNHINTESSIVISRDEIRFSIVKIDEEYFSHENEVLAMLWSEVTKGLKSGKNVFVDQTSLTPKARKYLIDNVDGYDKINAVWVSAPLNICLERNELRKGTRAYVPRGQIRRMYEQFIPPSFDEGFFRIYKYNSLENKLVHWEVS